MVRCKRLLAALCVACAVPVTAFGQYYVNLALVPTGPATCGSSGVSVPVTGTVDILLPEGGDNAWESRAVLGQPGSVSLKSIGGPFPQSTPSVGNLSLSTPAPVPSPYTLVILDYPAQNGAPIGIGTRIVAECSAEGAATVTFISGIAAPLPAAVPALGGMAQLLLAAVLAAAARRRLRQRGGV